MYGKSSEFEVFFSAKALRQLKALGIMEQKRIKEAVRKIESFPPATDVVKVQTQPGVFRMRAGNQRIFFRYRFDLKQVEIIAILPREHAY
ncbi:MAG: type II toxin-antitoxin system RelE family toxin [Desulfotomaculales bacterium]